MKRLMGAVTCVLVAGLLTLPPVAAQLWPSQGSKTVDSVNLKNGLIVVGDIQFRVTSATRVYTPTGSLGTLQQLRKGMQVQVNTVEPMGSGSAAISEIRIVPGN